MVEIYIINYKPLVERYNYLNKTFKSIKQKVNFIIQNKNEHTQDTIKKRYIPNKQIWLNKFKYLNKKNTPFYNLSKASINLNLNHYKIWMKIYQSNYNYALILEDDVIIEPNFLKKIKECILKLNRLD